MNRTPAVLHIATMAAAITLAGCGVSSDESVTPSPRPNATFKASYVPLAGVVPFPNDLFFSGSVDGTIGLPATDPTDYGDPLVAMSALDGFSTIAPIFVPFSSAIDAASVGNADVVMVDVTNPAAPAPLVAGTDYSVGVSPAADGGNWLQVTLLRPLAAKSRYGVIVLRSITGGGTAVSPDTAFQNILDARAGGTLDPSLTAVAAAVGPILDGANAFGITDAQIAVAFTFATQSTSDVLATVETDATVQASTIASAGVTNKQILDPTGANPAIVGRGNIYAGFVQVPYYLADGTAALTGRWEGAANSHLTRFNPTPVAKSTQTIPLLVAIPNANSPSGGVKPAGGWPVLVFQHGITGNRTQMLAVVDAAAAAGFAVFAIDQPLHGLPPNHALAVPGVSERTFGLDLVDNTTGAAGADGTVDSSGTHYINLSSLLTSRDNLRQSAADLIHLTRTIPSVNYDGIAGGDFDASRIHFLGHSLGGIVGTTFLGVSDNAQAAVLAMPGGGIARLLRDSVTFGPRINAGLAASGVVAGSQLYEDFLRNAQTAVDAGDPLNYAAAAATGHPILMFQVVGDGGATNLPDQVVPNTATARLATAMGLTRFTAAGANINAGGHRALVNFVAGDHGSILSPTASAAVTVEMQTQMANFIGSNGALLQITDGTVIQP